MKYKKNNRNALQRGKKKASYDQNEIFSILDAVEICHIAFDFDGLAMVQPINFGRNNDKLYIHGSKRNRMTQAILEAGEVCLNVMILDAMKLTRSAYHHSVNYRSANIFGKAKEITIEAEKLKGLQAIINHFVPNRWEHCRLPNEKELKATRVIEITIESASAKIADSPTNDNKSDLDLPFWAGVIPVNTNYGTPIPANDLKEETGIPIHIARFLNSKQQAK